MSKTTTAKKRITSKQESINPSKQEASLSTQEAKPEEKKENTAPTKAAAPKKRGRPRKSVEAAKKATDSKQIIETSKAEPKAPLKPSGKERLFALDIGTRSVIGIIAEQNEDGSMNILRTARREHKTRAMLDGQIHDVPQVASIVREVKDILVRETGPIKSAAVAAAGRALYTMTADASLEVNGIITKEQERGLDFAGVQAAQAKLASSHTIDDPTRYYCVGYSTIKYVLDDVPLKSLVGQRGKLAKASIIATFLPRQVIDSMQSALHAADLEMRALTLEPIAAINVLIPPTMRHLNLVLVDIGAGTSDVAITKNGSIIAYGMVPLAGDEITEAISQKFLLDFNVAEDVKRKATAGKGAVFSDILGAEYDLSADEIIQPILPSVQNLAEAIAKQILELNSEAPQAVMLVGGGSLTPKLADFVSEALAMPLNRVSIRTPDKVNDITEVPLALRSPDAVTPLGILKIASINTLHFLSVYVNEEEFSLFNFRELTISDALLHAGIQLRKFNGHPGLGLMITINGEKESFPGTLGTFAEITMDGKPAELDTIVKNDSHITILPGKNGTTPELHINDVIQATEEYRIYINGEEEIIHQQIFINNLPAAADYVLKDGDIIETREPKTLGEALRAAGLAPMGRRIRYTFNGQASHYSCRPEIFVNEVEASISQPINEGDRIEYNGNDTPKLGDVLNLRDSDTSITIYYNKEETKIPAAGVELTVNGRPASTGTIIEDGCDIKFSKSPRMATIVSEVLLAVNFQPPAATSRKKVTILVNQRPAVYTDPVKNGDSLDIIIASIDEAAPSQAEPISNSAGVQTLSAVNQSARPKEPKISINPSTIPGLDSAIQASRQPSDPTPPATPKPSPFSSFIKNFSDK